jgi:hypothetical protein
VSITIASVIRRRPFATAAILGALMVSSAFVTPLVITRPDKMRYLVLASPLMVGDGVTTWIFDTTTVKAPVDSMLFAPVPPPLPHADSATMARHRAEVRRRSHGRERMSVIQIANLPGSLYLGTTALLLIVSAGVLALRYRNIET